MKSYRKVVYQALSVPTMEGAGVRLRRAFGFQDPEKFDPFLLLDDFRGDRPDLLPPGFVAWRADSRPAAGREGRWGGGELERGTPGMSGYAALARSCLTVAVRTAKTAAVRSWPRSVSR